MSAQYKIVLFDKKAGTVCNLSEEGNAQGDTHTYESEPEASAAVDLLRKKGLPAFWIKKNDYRRVMRGDAVKPKKQRRRK